MSDEAIQVRRIEPREAWDLRRRVLRDNDPDAVLVWPHDHEPGTAHFGAMLEGALSAVGMAYAAPMKEQGFALGIPAEAQWQFRGMASDPEARGKGCGAAVMRAIIEHARVNGARLLWCNARIGAIGFYEKFGFACVGEGFEMPKIGPHVVMVLRV